MNLFEKLKKAYTERNGKPEGYLLHLCQSFGCVMDRVGNTNDDSEKKWIGYIIVHTVFYHWSMLPKGEELKNIVARVEHFDSYDVESVQEQVGDSFLGVSALAQAFADLLNNHYIRKNVELSRLPIAMVERFKEKGIAMLSIAFDYALSKGFYPKDCTEKALTDL